MYIPVIEFLVKMYKKKLKKKKSFCMLLKCFALIDANMKLTVHSVSCLMSKITILTKDKDACKAVIYWIPFGKNTLLYSLPSVFQE